MNNTFVVQEADGLGCPSGGQKQEISIYDSLRLVTGNGTNFNVELYVLYKLRVCSSMNVRYNVALHFFYVYIMYAK